jgi:hypothetical protein
MGIQLLSIEMASKCTNHSATTTLILSYQRRMNELMGSRKTGRVVYNFMNKANKNDDVNGLDRSEETIIFYCDVNIYRLMNNESNSTQAYIRMLPLQIPK